MTMDNNLMGGQNAETCNIPSVLVDDPSDSAALHSQWPFEGDIVKVEIIIPAEKDEPRMCRLCRGVDTIWFPFYNNDGRLRLEQKHLEILQNVASIRITNEADHSSVVCSFCLMKVEEFSIISNIWRNNDIKESSSTSGLEQTPPSGPAVNESSVNGTVSDATAQQTEEFVIIDDTDDAERLSISSSETSVQETNIKRRTRSDSIKEDFIQQAMKIVGKQFNRKKTKRLRNRRRNLTGF